jgi:hypothetical protein
LKATDPTPDSTLENNVGREEITIIIMPETSTIEAAINRIIIKQMLTKKASKLSKTKKMVQ